MIDIINEMCKNAIALTKEQARAYLLSELEKVDQDEKLRKEITEWEINEYPAQAKKLRKNLHMDLVEFASKRSHILADLYRLDHEGEQQ